ncbi:MAG: hypothetical protein ACYCPT_13130 [Acidimicrobiales bacterium]
MLTSRLTTISLCSANDWHLNGEVVGVHDVLADAAKRRVRAKIPKLSEALN